MKYYKSYSESDEGDEGEFFCEVKNGAITRHVSVFGTKLYWATPNDEFDERYFFTDQPEFQLTDSEEEISEHDFSLVWDRAVRQRE